MRTLTSICVYCGSSNAPERHFFEAAGAFGAFCADAGLRVVYGGGRVGLMGAVADAALAGGGEVVGVIPERLMDRELGHPGLTELHIVQGMHPRKKLMADLSDAFVALPGGFGTLEELFEVTTWTQLNYHVKPVGLLNIAGYYDHLVAFLDRARSEHFIRPIHAGLIQVADDAGDLLHQLRTVDIPHLDRWIDNP